jgi:hypothetical protein
MIFPGGNTVMNKINALFLCCFLIFCCNKGERSEKSQEKAFEYSEKTQDQEKIIKNINHINRNKSEEKLLKHSKQNRSEEDNYNVILETKWIAPIISTSGRVFFDSLIFKRDCTVVNYSCEFEAKSFGRFDFKYDTVIIKSDISYYPDHITYEEVFKLLLFINTLVPVYAKFGHLDPKTEFDSTYIFYKDTNAVLEEGSESNEKQ